ncbi:MAG TPA: septation protein SepH [Acidimicrobiales bacterium]|nr:septation protein SepH [Acidimicrobiales bacterium]
MRAPVQQLHLVGVTTESDGLIFSPRKGSRSGGFVVSIDEALIEAIEQAARMRAAEPELEEAPAPLVPRLRTDRPQSMLTPREMQTRLRAGHSIGEVARAAQVDEEWVARFAVPVMAEQQRVVETALRLTCFKARVGSSALPLGDSVRSNLYDRGIPYGPDNEGWDAFTLDGTNWIVRYSYVSRRRHQVAEWEIDSPAGAAVPRNRLATELGYVDSARRRRGLPPASAVREAEAVPEAGESAPAPGRRRAGAGRRPPSRSAGRSRSAHAPAEGAAPKTAGAGTASGVTARKSTGKSAGRKTGARRTTAAKARPSTTTARKTSARRTVARKAAPRPATAGRTTARKTTTVRKTTAPRKATARKATARKATAPRTAMTARTATGRKTTTARKTASASTPARKAVARKTTARKTAARKTTARKTTARKTTARKTAPRKTSPRKTAIRTPARQTTGSARKATPRRAAQPTATRRKAAGGRATPARRPAGKSVPSARRATTRKPSPPRRPRPLRAPGRASAYVGHPSEEVTEAPIAAPVIRAETAGSGDTVAGEIRIAGTGPAPRRPRPLRARPLRAR